MFIKYARLMAAAETAGGGPAATVDQPAKAALEQAVDKLFSDDAAPPAKAPDATDPKTAKPPGDKPGETIDLSQPAKPAPKEEAKAQTPEEAEAEKAEAAELKLSVEDYRKAKAEEQSRLEAIAAKTGESFEEIYAREEKEGKPTDLENAPAKTPKTFTQEEMEAAIQKRVKNLAAENEQLKQQLAEKPAVQPIGLDQIEAQAASTQANVDLLEDLQADLNRAELREDSEALTSVEQRLRAMLGEGAAKADFSPAGMRRMLRTAQRTLEQQLQVLPQQRAAYLELQSKTEARVAEQAAWLKDDTDPRTAFYKEMERVMPGIKATPTWKYWLAAAVEQHFAWQTKKPAGKPALKLKIKSALPGTGTPPAAPKVKNTFAQAKQKGDLGAMADALGLD